MAPFDGIEIVDDPYAACAGADVVVVLTEWDELRWLDLDKLGDAMTGRAIVDTRNILDRGAVTRRGFAYQAIGRN